MEMENKKIQKVDIDYTNEAVPQTSRKGFGAMFVIMLGFTFFSASMWTGVDLANGLDLTEVFSGDVEQPVTRAMAAKILYSTSRKLEAQKQDTVI